MTFKLLKSRDQVRRMATVVMEYLAKIANVGPPPRGVAGRRKSGAFRSEMDKKNKEILDKLTAEKRAEFQGKADKQLGNQLAEIDAVWGSKVAAADKSLSEQEAKPPPWYLTVGAEREAHVEQLRVERGQSTLLASRRYGDQFRWTKKLAKYWAKRRGEEQERRRNIMAKIEKQFREMRSYVEFSQRHIWDEYVNDETKQAREEIRRRMGSFEWRMAYAFDTYGGKGYRGTVKLEKKNFSGVWELVKEATAPAK